MFLNIGRYLNLECLFLDLIKTSFKILRALSIELKALKGKLKDILNSH